MTQLLGGVAFAAALTIAAPVWAQVSTTTEDLNRQELNRVAAKTAGPIVLVPAIGYSFVSRGAPPQFLVPPPQPNFTAYSDRFPFPWLYRYYGYQAPVTYEYINLGSSGRYAPVPALSAPYWD